MEAERIGYLHENFKLFHIKDVNRRTFDFHYHDFHKILFLVQGLVSYNVEGNIYSLRPNDFVLIQSGQIHCPVIDENCLYERYILYISPAYLEQFRQKNNDLETCFEKSSTTGSYVVRFQPAVSGLLLEKLAKIETCFQDTSFGNDILKENAFLEFLVFLNRFCLSEQTIFETKKSYSIKMAPIIEYINEHLTEELSIDFLANHFFLSKSYLMHTFKNETGYTISNYLSTKRLFLARDLILKGSPILEACYNSGFSNYTTFSRAYKNKFGEPPKKLR